VDILGKDFGVNLPEGERKQSDTTVKNDWFARRLW